MLRSLLFGLLIAAVSANCALAIEGGDARRGKFLVKNQCKDCHREGDAAGNVTPLSKTMQQWDRFFEKNQHPQVPFFDFTEKELLDINQYLFNHAVDSDQPETCS